MSKKTKAAETELKNSDDQGQDYAANMAEIFDVSQRIWQKFIESHADDKPATDPDPLNAIPTFAELGRTMMANPQEVADATLEFWQAQGALWHHAASRWLGKDAAGEEPDLPHMAQPTKRFAHKDWSENAVFDYIKQSYLLTSGWMQDTVHTVGDMAPKDRKKADFYTRQFVEAMNPANFFALNPEVLEATVEEKGQNLVRGLNMMLEDMERGKGKLLIRQTDMDAFEVGGNTAVSDGQVVWQNNILQLIQYAPATETVHAEPLLIIPPWINKYYVLDLNPKKSMAKWLVERGHTVFMVSWVNPDEAQKNETWESYMLEGVSNAIDQILKETGQKKANLAAYCVGGTLTGSLLAYLGKNKDKRVNSATFFAAQLDFEDAGELQIFVDEQTLELIDAQMEKGYLPADTMASAFNMLRANDLIWSYVVNNYMLGKDPFPFDLLYWNADSTAMPANVHHFYLEQFYTRNAFVKEKLVIADTKLKLSDISVPVYHVATKEDHIAPADSVYRGAKLMTGADVRFVLSGSGHIAGVVNPPALGKYQFWTNDDLSAENLDDWLAAAEETPGSWWTDWDKWLSGRGAEMVPERKPGAVLGAIEPAPGAYVKLRFDER